VHLLNTGPCFAYTAMRKSNLARLNKSGLHVKLTPNGHTNAQQIGDAKSVN